MKPAPTGPVPCAVVNAEMTNPDTNFIRLPRRSGVVIQQEKLARMIKRALTLLSAGDGSHG